MRRVWAIVYFILLSFVFRVVTLDFSGLGFEFYVVDFTTSFDCIILNESRNLYDVMIGVSCFTNVNWTLLIYTPFV